MRIKHKKYPIPYTLKPKPSAGYVGIVSALIISAIIVIVIITVGQVSFLSRINISDTHLKGKSRALAEACVNYALLRLAYNSSYAGNEIINVASDTCKIVAVSASSTGRVISAQGKFQGAVTDLQVTVPSNSVSVISWEEVRSF